MSTNSARTWTPVPVAVESPSPVCCQGQSGTCTKLPRKHGEPEPVGCTKEGVRDIDDAQGWGALKPAPVPAVPPRPQLKGRRIYRDNGIKPLD